MEIDDLMLLKKCLICESNLNLERRQVIPTLIENVLGCKNSCMIVIFFSMGDKIKSDYIHEVDIFDKSKLYNDYSDGDVDIDKLMINFVESEVSYWRKDYRYLAELLGRE